MARLKKLYNETIIPKLQKELNLDCIMEVPKITKITLNMGVDPSVDKNALDPAIKDLEKIAGQKPLKTMARKSVASFKIRQGYPIGAKVTLRRERMYEFLDRLISIALPRVRDFRGIPAKSFDGSGNFNFGIQEQIVFPEIDFEETDKIRGMNITITTNARNNEEGLALLQAFNFPFAGVQQMKRK